MFSSQYRASQSRNGKKIQTLITQENCHSIWRTRSSFSRKQQKNVGCPDNQSQQSSSLPLVS